MISQSAFAAGGGSVAVADGQGVGEAEAVWAGSTGVAVEVAADSVGPGVAAEVVGLSVALALAVEAVAAGVAVLAEVEAGDEVAAAGVRQGVVCAAEPVEELSMVLICGAMTSAVPTARATARNPPIKAECARGRGALGLR